MYTVSVLLLLETGSLWGTVDSPGHVVGGYTTWALTGYCIRTCKCIPVFGDREEHHLPSFHPLERPSCSTCVRDSYNLEGIVAGIIPGLAAATIHPLQQSMSSSLDFDSSG